MSPIIILRLALLPAVSLEQDRRNLQLLQRSTCDLLTSERMVGTRSSKVTEKLMMVEAKLGSAQSGARIRLPWPDMKHRQITVHPSPVKGHATQRRILSLVRCVILEV